MKKLYSLMILAAFCLGLASCSDDKGEPTQLSTIQVLAAETSFESAPSTGKVVVDCNPVKAYVDAADQNWLDVKIDQNTVLLSINRNSSTESRNALLTIKKNDNDSVMLNIAQKGMIFSVEGKTDILQHNDRVGEYSFKVSSEILPQIISTPNWIEANMTNEKLSVKVLENNEGHIREGYVKYACGNIKDSIKITQFEFEKDLLGNYELWTGYDEKTDLCEHKWPVTISATESGSITMNLTTEYDNKTVNFQFPMTFDSDSLKFTMTSGQNLGSYLNKKKKRIYFFGIFGDTDGVYLQLQDEKNNILLTDNTGTISAMMKHENGKGTYGTFSGLAYNNSGNVATFGYLYIGAFTGSQPKESELVNDKFAFYFKDMMLVKKDK